MNTKESTMQKTLTIGPHPHQLLANAVLHLANAVESPGDGVSNRCREARDLVRHLAFPGHVDSAGHEADRVMVRAVSPGHPGLADPRDMWVLDPGATGHRAPFSRGDFVVRSSGREGIHRVVDVSVDVYAPRHRSLCITVEPTDVVVDQDAF